MGRVKTFMNGRYGQDQLNRIMLALGIALLIAYLFLGWRLLRPLVLLMLVLPIIRMFSRNVERRRWENERFLLATGGLRRWGRLQKSRWRNRKTHRYFHCPQCDATMRVPRGQGLVSVRCIRCGHEFQKKT